jgi:hypothetical protein
MDLGVMRTGGVALAALGVLLVIEATIFFVLPHGEHFAPEIGPGATFVVFAILLSAQFLVGFIAGFLVLLTCSGQLESLQPVPRRLVQCAVFTGTAVAASAVVARDVFSPTTEIIPLALVFFLAPALLAAAMLTHERRTQA